MDINLIVQWSAISLMTGGTFAIFCYLVFIAYDIWRQHNLINWKERMKELFLMALVFPFILVLFLVILIIGWPVMAFFIIKEELNNRTNIYRSY